MTTGFVLGVLAHVSEGFIYVSIVPSVSEMLFGSDGIKVLIYHMDELFVIRLLLIPCGFKKSVICTCVFGLCFMPLGGKPRSLAGCLWGLLEVEGLTKMSCSFGGVWKAFMTHFLCRKLVFWLLPKIFQLEFLLFCLV